MNAQLITARAIEPAAYDNQSLHMFGLWYRDNVDALRDRYEALGKVVPTHHGDSFLQFCATKWDQERFR